MSKGKFSNPRPYREEEREIEKSFRQLTGQEPVKPAEDTMPLPTPGDEASLKSIDPEAAGLLSEADDLVSGDAPEIPVENSEFPMDIPEETTVSPSAPSLPDKVMDFVSNNQKTVMIALCAVALILIISVIAIIVVSASGDPYDNRILNNVTVAGVNVGGMSKSEAIEAVKAATDHTYTEQDMVISLGETTLQLSPADTKAKLDVKAAVGAAYNYGRTGSKTERQEAYEASLRGNHTIGVLTYMDLDTQYIRGVLEDYAGDTGSLLTETTYELDGNVPDLATDRFDEATALELTLIITMGTPGVNFNVDELYNQILDAYSLNLFSVKTEGAQADAEPEDVDLQKIYDEICVEPVNATMNRKTFEAIPGSYGYEFDLTQAQKQVNAAAYGDVLRIPMEYVAPEIAGEDMFFRDTLASVSTSFTTNTNWAANISLASQAINGKVLNPGDSFSLNNTVGDRTTDRGYKSASCSGSEILGNVGGGVCQVASTLYCATLTADLEIISRTSHSYGVSYARYGLDADIGGSADFKFRNNTNYPIQLQAEVSGSSLTVRILGTDEKDYYVELSYAIASTNNPDTKYQDYKYDNSEGYKDGDVIQEGVTGYQIKTYSNKYNKSTGVLMSKDFIANTQYKTIDKVVARVEAAPTEPSTEPSTEATEPSTTAPAEPSTETTVPPDTTVSPSTDSTTSGEDESSKTDEGSQDNSSNQTDENTLQE